MTCNKLIGIPIDKIAFPLLILFLGIKNGTTFYYKNRELFSVFFIAVLCLSTYIFNYENVSPSIFTVLIGYLFIIVFSRSKISYIATYYSLSMYVLLCLVIFGLSYIFPLYDYVRPLWEKNMPWFHSPLGFSPTKQILGTYCIINLLLYLIIEKTSQYKSKSKLVIFFVIANILCILLIFSRSTQIVLLIILGMRFRKTAIMILISSLIFTMNQKSVLESLLNIQTIDSRFKFVEGFLFNFEYNSSLVNYLIGSANTDLPDYIVAYTNALNPYVENLSCALIYTFGFLGFILYYSYSVYGVYIMRKLSFDILIIAILYLFFVPQSTHELYTPSTYLLVAICLNYNYRYIVLNEKTN